MDTINKAILERYSCRDFASKPMSKEHAKELANAALAAPSAMNLQPWHIIVITNKALIDEMDLDAMSILKEQSGESYNRIMGRGGKIFYNAPCIVIIAKDSSDYATLDVGIATQNVALAAHGLGLSSVICGMARIPLSGPRASEWAKRLQMPAGFTFGMSICVGHAQTTKPPHDLDFSKLTYIE